ncbi:hypothetical protein H4I96_00463 [Botrytis cinerea]
MSCTKSLNATIATPNSSGLICRRCVPCIIHPDVEQNTEKTTEKPLVNARNSVSSKPNKSEKIRETLNLSGDQDQSLGTVKKELKANSIDNEDIAKVLSPVQHDFLTQIEVAEDETIKLLKRNHQASRIKLGKAQEAYLAALQTKFLQSNLQSFLARLQQANNKTSGIKRNRGISEP